MGSGGVTESFSDFIGHNYGGKLFRASYDPNALTVTANEEWGADHGAVNGFIDYAELQGNRKYSSTTNPEKTRVYTTGGMAGTVGNVIVWDVETGENLATWDQSDIWLFDNKGSDRVGGPGYVGRMYNGEPDPVGLTISSHFTSVVMRVDWNTGAVKWLNRNGDGYGDRFAFVDGKVAEAVYGATAAVGNHHDLSSSKWGWVASQNSGVDNVNYGFMLGEDGSGLFWIKPKNIPFSWPQFTIIVDADDSDWDGLYISIGGNDAALKETNDWIVKDADGNFSPYDFHYLVHYPYDQKRVSLGIPTAVEELEGAPLPSSYALGDAYPNPFNPETTIRFSLPWEAPVKVEIYNDQGQFVRDLVDDRMGPGEFTVTWDGTDATGAEVASGVYLYKIEAPNLRLSKKVTLLK